MSTVDRISTPGSYGRGDDDRAPLRDLRRLALLFFVSAAAFFPLIMNPLVFDYFDAETDAARLDHVNEHFTGLRLVFTGIGVTELALGVALWWWGRTVADRSTGRRASVADAFGKVGLAGGAIWFLTRLSVWVQDAEAFASDDLSTLDIATGLIGGAASSLTFIVFGYLMVRGAMPRWLGVMWILCGLMFWAGILPLWFFVAAIAFGIRGLIRFRPGRSPAEAGAGRSTAG